MEKKVCRTSITNSMVVYSSLNRSTLYIFGGLILLRSIFSNDVLSLFVFMTGIVAFMCRCMFNYSEYFFKFI